MPTFKDNINIINTAIYGKEMRPAISEALNQSWDAVKIMMGAVDQLNSRVDALSGGGSGGSGGGNEDGSITISGTVLPTTIVVYGIQTELEAVGTALSS